MILITGAAGYIGSHLSLELIKKYKVLGLDNFANSNFKVINSIRGKDLKRNFKFVKIDLKNKNKLENIFKKNSIKLLINCAALTNINESMTKKKKYYENNIKTLSNCLSLMNKYGCNKIIHCSTAALYDVNNSVPFKESSKLKALSVYSKTKLINELDIIKFSKKNNINYYILRFFNPIGINKKHFIFNYNNRGDLFSNIKRSITEKKKFFINGNNWPTKDGTCIRDFISIFDLIDGIKKSVKIVMKKEIKKSKILNLGSGNTYTILEILKKYEKIIKKKINYKFKRKLKYEVYISAASISNSAKALKWKPKNNLMAAIRSQWQY